MVGRLAAVPEESMDCSTAAYPPRGVYCDRIRKVAVSGVQIRSTICSHSQSGHSGSRSSCSTASNSYPSNNSGCSSGSASDVHSTSHLRPRRISSTTMEEMSTVMDDGDDRLWAIEIKHGGGGIHKNTRLGMNFIMSMFKAANLTQNSEMCPESLGGLLDSMICYLKIFLFRKSQLCTDIGLRYLFQLNYSYFISQECAPSFSLDATMLGSPAPQSLLAPELTGECNQYMARYLDASWGHVLSCIPRSHFTRPIHRWINISSLTKFDSAFHRTYQAQKFWKVPDPLLRDMLRRVITDRVVSSYRHYLKEHPELEKHIGRESSNPKVLEDMLGELFEG
ncbi:exocyst complex component EXO70E2-like [Aegilops tauschii subsp. strangulata]|uniref:exocyst complex component EXO70E2-like n=1 Tax=Aegilops tauschii subsp. strangulata TaxID=200361 RepID=UPI000989C9DA